MLSDRDISGSVSVLFRQLRAGDPEAIEHLWERFRPRLLGLAQSTLRGRWLRMTDAEDALQSAFVSFWQRAERGEFGDELNRDDLWNVLGVITVRKALKHQEREGAQKRGGRLAASDVPLEEFAAPPSDPDMELTCMEMLEALDEELQTYALLRLMGYKNREIAAQLGCTERKVERKLQLIRTIWDAKVESWTK